MTDNKANRFNSYSTFELRRVAESLAKRNEDLIQQLTKQKSDNSDLKNQLRLMNYRYFIGKNLKEDKETQTELEVSDISVSQSVVSENENDMDTSSPATESKEIKFNFPIYEDNIQQEQQFQELDVFHSPNVADIQEIPTTPPHSLEKNFKPLSLSPAQFRVHLALAERCVNIELQKENEYNRLKRRIAHPISYREPSLQKKVRKSTKFFQFKDQFELPDMKENL